MYKFPLRKENILKVSVFIAGFTALMIQVIFMRAFLNILHGNELIIGIVLSNWLLLTGLGAYLGNAGFLRSNMVIGFHVAIGLLPAISIFALYVVRASWFPPGMVPGVAESWLLTFILMAPFCLVSGVVFTLYAKIFNLHYLQNRTSLVYAIEALGSLAGSLIFVLLLLRIFDIPQILLLLTSANFSVALLLSEATGSKRIYSHLILTGLFIWVVIHFAFDWYAQSRSMIHATQQIIQDVETPYGNLVVSRSGSQLNVIENGVPVFSNEDVQTTEERVHFAMLQHDAPQKVLVLSGNINDIWKEIEKYDVTRVDYVEINPQLIQVTKRFFDHPEGLRLFVHQQDPRAFIENGNSAFDVVLINIPPPASIQYNRFYTVEFFEALKRRLNPEGVVSLKLGGNINYLSDETLEIYSVLTRSLQDHFKNVIIIPGQSNYFLASDAALTYEIAKRTEVRNINNEYVNHFYVIDEMMEQRGTEVLNLIDEKAPANTDYKPIAFVITISNWLAWYNFEMKWVIGFFALLLFLLILAMGPAQRPMFLAGFTSMSVEVMLLLVFQVIFGYLYQALAILMASFMAGLALGSFIDRRIKIRDAWKTLTCNQMIIAFTALLVPGIILLNLHTDIPAFTMAFLLYAAVFLSGLFTGVHFSLSNLCMAGSAGKRASHTYGADLAGSAGGAIITVLVLIPFLGIVNTGLMLFGLNLLMASTMLLRGKLSK
jgi:spermidine synthase